MKGFLLSFAVILVFIAPTVALAQTGGIVPCNGPECQACHFVQLGQNLLSWFIKIMASVIAVVVAVAGLKMATAGGDTGKVSEAKSLMTNALIGFVILLSAWLIVDTVMKLVANPNASAGEVKLGVWHTITCVAQPPRTQTIIPTTPGTVTTAPSAGCPTCIKMPEGIPVNANPCKGACVMREEIAQGLVAANLSGLGLQLSEGFPPVANHAENCHKTATCVDLSFAQKEPPTGQQVETGATTLKAQGFTTVYEVQTAARATELRNSGVTNVLVVPTINREHYSAYKCNIDSSPKACKS